MSSTLQRNSEERRIAPSDRLSGLVYRLDNPCIDNAATVDVHAVTPATVREFDAAKPSNTICVTTLPRGEFDDHITDTRSLHPLAKFGAKPGHAGAEG